MTTAKPKYSAIILASMSSNGAHSLIITGCICCDK